MPYLYSFDAKMLSSFPKTASCVYSLGTGKIPCPTRNSYLHRKPQSPFSAQRIKAHFKKALYAWQAQQITDEQGCHGPFWGRLHLIYVPGFWTAKLPPATSISTKTSQIGVTVDWDPWKVHSLVSRFQKLLHDPYKIGMGENRSLPQLKEHKKVGVYSHKTGVLPKKQRKKGKKNYQKNLCMQKRQKSCLLPFILGRRMQLLPSFHYWQSNDNTNSACSSNNPWKVTIPTHSKSL